MAKKKKKSKVLRVILVIVIVAIGIASAVGYNYYRRIFLPNVSLSQDYAYLYIPTGSNIDSVVSIFAGNGYLKDIPSFSWVARKKNYMNHVKPGKYKIENGLNNNDLVDILRSGKQEPVRVVIGQSRSVDAICGKAAESLEADSTSISQILHNDKFMLEKGFKKEAVLGLFIPNTYEFTWNTSADQFVDRMLKEYNKFWNESRTQKAENLKLSKNQISTLASIVEMETVKKDERSKIAGVYLNRIKKGMRLQADPTVIFAIGDFSIKRVLNEHLKFDSPYNTYLYEGLPPGPIIIPSISSIDGVLNYEEHNYIYFCAKEDFSGYHNFATNLKDHAIFAARYRKELNRRKILK